MEWFSFCFHCLPNFSNADANYIASAEDHGRGTITWSSMHGFQVGVHNHLHLGSCRIVGGLYFEAIEGLQPKGQVSRIAKNLVESVIPPLPFFSGEGSYGSFIP